MSILKKDVNDRDVVKLFDDGIVIDQKLPKWVNASKRLAEKKRIEKASDDGIYDKVMDYVQKVMNVAEMFSKDPIKYAQHEYKIQSLLDMLGDRQRYDSGTRKSSSNCSG